jgi:hypothetical protein
MKKFSGSRSHHPHLSSPRPARRIVPSRNDDRKAVIAKTSTEKIFGRWSRWEMNLELVAQVIEGKSIVDATP